MNNDLRARVRESHDELFDFAQSQFGELMSTMAQMELELVKHCQGFHDRVAVHANERHQKIAEKVDPDFIRSLDNQGDELVRIVQSRFAEMTRDLKQCHGGACQTLNRRAADQVLELSRIG